MEACLWTDDSRMSDALSNGQFNVKILSNMVGAVRDIRFYLDLNGFDVILVVYADN